MAANRPGSDDDCGDNDCDDDRRSSPLSWFSRRSRSLSRTASSATSCRIFVSGVHHRCKTSPKDTEGYSPRYYYWTAPLVIAVDDGGSRGWSRQHPQCSDRGTDLLEENTYIVPGWPCESRTKGRRRCHGKSRWEIRGKFLGNNNGTVMTTANQLLVRFLLAFLSHETAINEGMRSFTLEHRLFSSAHSDIPGLAFPGGLLHP